jgi:hypothetical protein
MKSTNLSCRNWKNGKQETVKVQDYVGHGITVLVL